jgi:hypothetical protein
MEVKNCKNCGRLYNYIGGVYRLCPECMRKLEEKFQEVKDYIENNPRADMREISVGRQLLLECRNLCMECAYYYFRDACICSGDSTDF